MPPIAVGTARRAAPDSPSRPGTGRRPGACITSSSTPPPDAPIELFSSPVDVPIELAPLLAGVAPGRSCNSATARTSDRYGCRPASRCAGSAPTARSSTAARAPPSRWRAAPGSNTSPCAAAEPRIAWFPQADRRRRRAAHTRARLPRRRPHRRRAPTIPGSAPAHAAGVVAERRRPRSSCHAVDFDGHAMGRRRRDRRWAPDTSSRAASSTIISYAIRISDTVGATVRGNTDRGPLVGCPSGADRGDQRGRQRVRAHDAGRRRRRRGARAR